MLCGALVRQQEVDPEERDSQSELLGSKEKEEIKPDAEISAESETYEEYFENPNSTGNPRQQLEEGQDQQEKAEISEAPRQQFTGNYPLGHHPAFFPVLRSVELPVHPAYVFNPSSDAPLAGNINNLELQQRMAVWSFLRSLNRSTGFAELIETVHRSGSENIEEVKTRILGLNNTIAAFQQQLHPLLRAAFSGNAWAVAFVCQIPGIDLNQRPLTLGYAALLGMEDVVQTLIAHGAILNNPPDVQENPLHMAALANNLSMVRLLIANGADPKHGVGPARTVPLDLAVFYGHWDVLNDLNWTRVYRIPERMRVAHMTTPVGWREAFGPDQGGSLAMERRRRGYPEMGPMRPWGLDLREFVRDTFLPPLVARQFAQGWVQEMEDNRGTALDELLDKLYPEQKTEPEGTGKEKAKSEPESQLEDNMLEKGNDSNAIWEVEGADATISLRGGAPPGEDYCNSYSYGVPPTSPITDPSSTQSQNTGLSRNASPPSESHSIFRTEMFSEAALTRESEDDLDEGSAGSSHVNTTNPVDASTVINLDFSIPPRDSTAGTQDQLQNGVGEVHDRRSMPRRTASEVGQDTWNAQVEVQTPRLSDVEAQSNSNDRVGIFRRGRLLAGVTVDENTRPLSRLSMRRPHEHIQDLRALSRVLLRATSFREQSQSSSSMPHRPYHLDRPAYQISRLYRLFIESLELQMENVDGAWIQELIYSIWQGMTNSQRMNIMWLSDGGEILDVIRRRSRGQPMELLGLLQETGSSSNGSDVQMYEHLWQAPNFSSSAPEHTFPTEDFLASMLTSAIIGTNRNSSVLFGLGSHVESASRSSTNSPERRMRESEIQFLLLRAIERAQRRRLLPIRALDVLANTNVQSLSEQRRGQSVVQTVGAGDGWLTTSEADLLYGPDQREMPWRDILGVPGYIVTGPTINQSQESPPGFNDLRLSTFQRESPERGGVSVVAHLQELESVRERRRRREWVQQVLNRGGMNLLEEEMEGGLRERVLRVGGRARSPESLRNLVDNFPLEEQPEEWQLYNETDRSSNLRGGAAPLQSTCSEYEEIIGNGCGGFGNEGFVTVVAKTEDKSNRAMTLPEAAIGDLGGWISNGITLGGLWEPTAILLEQNSYSGSISRQDMPEENDIANFECHLNSIPIKGGELDYSENMALNEVTGKPNEQSPRLVASSAYQSPLSMTTCGFSVDTLGVNTLLSASPGHSLVPTVVTLNEEGTRSTTIPSQIVRVQSGTEMPSPETIGSCIASTGGFDIKTVSTMAGSTLLIPVATPGTAFKTPRELFSNDGACIGIETSSSNFVSPVSSTLNPSESPDQFPTLNPGFSPPLGYSSTLARMPESHSGVLLENRGLEDWDFVNYLEELSSSPIPHISSYKANPAIRSPSGCSFFAPNSVFKIDAINPTTCQGSKKQTFIPDNKTLNQLPQFDSTTNPVLFSTIGISGSPETKPVELKDYTVGFAQPQPMSLVLEQEFSNTPSQFDEQLPVREARQQEQLPSQTPSQARLSPSTATAYISAQRPVEPPKIFLPKPSDFDGNTTIEETPMCIEQQFSAMLAPAERVKTQEQTGVQADSQKEVTASANMRSVVLKSHLHHTLSVPTAAARPGNSVRHIIQNMLDSQTGTILVRRVGRMLFPFLTEEDMSPAPPAARLGLACMKMDKEVLIAAEEVITGLDDWDREVSVQERKKMKEEGRLWVEFEKFLKERRSRRFGTDGEENERK